VGDEVVAGAASSEFSSPSSYLFFNLNFLCFLVLFFLLSSPSPSFPSPEVSSPSSPSNFSAAS
jgi:hypothetical protein